MKNSFFLLALFVLPTTLQAQHRVSLVETFSSATCAPCNPGNYRLESILTNEENKNNTVSITYQMDWPGTGDPYYTEEAGVRSEYYAVTGVPSTILDGRPIVNPNHLVQEDLDEVHTIDPKAIISGGYQVDPHTQTVAIDVDIEMMENIPSGAQLFVAIFEYELLNNQMNNGETKFKHVMKKIINGEEGIALPSMMKGDVYNWEGEYTFAGDYRLPNDALDPIDHSMEHSIEEFSDLGLAIWIQGEDGEVYQAAYGKPSVLREEEVTNAIASAELYPNPANVRTTIAVQIFESQDVMIEVFNTNGQLLYSETLQAISSGRITHDISTVDLPNGVYTVRASSTNGMIAKRLVVQH